MRSFSSVWYWIALAVLWSTASHWVLGIPFDMVSRAASRGGQAQTDLEDMTRVMTNRLLSISRISGLWLLGLACFFLTSLALIGFLYEVQMAQAVFLMVFPMSLVGLLSLNTARRIQNRQASGEELRKVLWRHRVMVQVVGMIAIFVTAMWGMYQNLKAGMGNHFGPMGAIEQQVDDDPNNGWGRPGGV
ncbi:component of SufBCD complex [Lutimaribacter sp. EGI FJ00015]|uniref:Component of SufBCD complex n=2 Tax=Lutimaribacter degradans TaxID=2945989 RepID=A0ACC5ZV64_9RHOB|nr:component of SufBCD complex [Lutimaribacter sp. EGI FJ00013]MCM2562234.1 component of SufBCD complex [Lutimaribacter sp. EGI FJ00013]MCO0613389.1 component of SufBCD complex [Lutimaribacter sp. EGI FJ00015]MCO0636363.1 component of SufBCD complex [Lutimaribacter sp. EGI FJ00014]